MEAFSPKLSIVIPVWNEADKTVRCLHSIHTHTRIPYEVIWVDNGSDARNRRIIQKQATVPELHTRLVQFDHNVGFVKATNAGIKAASQPSAYIMLLNNDTEVSPGWDTKLTAPLSDTDVGAVGPITQSRIGWQEPNNLNKRWNLGLPTYTGNEKVPYQNEIVAYTHTLEETKKNQYVESHGIPLAFFCVCMRKATIEDVGLLDEDFGYGLGDDDEYCYRLRAHGYKLLVSLSTFVYHHHRTTFKALNLPVDEIRRTNVQILSKKKHKIAEELARSSAQEDPAPQPVVVEK